MAEVIDHGAYQKLLDVGPNVTRAIERRVLRRTAKIVQRRGKKEAPISEPEDLPEGRRPGDLRRSIKIRAARRRNDGTQAIEIYSSLPYANPIHWGWPKRGIRRDLFLIAALDAEQMQIVNEFKDAVEQEIAKLN